MLTALQTQLLAEQHPSLGPDLKPGGTSGALNTFNKIVSQGIRPSDTLVDYGCGTLRVGSLFIEHLEAGHYIGMDIDQRILAAGLNQLPAELVESKRPTLEVISPDSLARVAARQPRGFVRRESCSTCHRKNSTSSLETCPISFMRAQLACSIRR
jgi:hypothetical protein